ncbi:hypothetical protein [Conexibacter sp. SYSU D00693]|uniref:hypothetical protein n=1 Tax=Conexibacter sp. SYSU D00693 TaxID=2812560 RepID=UPI00196A4530|nr:hypothetical protein [Conexibacter sp. SYSU D00693]
MSERHETDAFGAAVQAAAAEVRAPQALRERLATLEAPPRRRRTHWPSVLAGALTALLVALVVVLGGGNDGPADVLDGVELALRAPTAPPPARDARDQRFTALRVGRVRVPDYGYGTGWEARGRRTDEVDGRRAVTLLYRTPAGRQVGYTVVDGTLPVPGDVARHAGGPRGPAEVRRDGAGVLTWRVQGQTCLLAGRGVGPDELRAAYDRVTGRLVP